LLLYSLGVESPFCWMLAPKLVLLTPFLLNDFPFSPHDNKSSSPPCTLGNPFLLPRFPSLFPSLPTPSPNLEMEAYLIFFKKALTHYPPLFPPLRPSQSEGRSLPFLSHRQPFSPPSLLRQRRLVSPSPPHVELKGESSPIFISLSPFSSPTNHIFEGSPLFSFSASFFSSNSRSPFLPLRARPLSLLDFSFFPTSFSTIKTVDDPPPFFLGRPSFSLFRS